MCACMLSVCTTHVITATPDEPCKGLLTPPLNTGDRS